MTPFPGKQPRAQELQSIPYPAGCAGVGPAITGAASGWIWAITTPAPWGPGWTVTTFGGITWTAGERGALAARLYHPGFFHPDGIAVHGYPSVPAYPASHGCARVTMAAMDRVWPGGLMPSGSTVLVH